MKVLFVHQDSIQSGSVLCLYESKEDGIISIVLPRNDNTHFCLFQNQGIETYHSRFDYTFLQREKKIV